MRKLLVIPVLLLWVSLAFPAVLKVASDGTQPYTQISSAISAAVAGDTILVMGGSYSGFVVDKKLVIIGAGTGVGVGEGVLVNSYVEVLDAADSTEIRSLWLRGSYTSSTADSLSAVLRIRSGATRVFVWRCFIENYYSSTYGCAGWVGIGSSVEFVQSIFWYSGSADASTRYAINYRTNSNMILTSCVLANFERGLHQYAATTGATTTVSHCIFTSENSYLYVADGSIAGVAENCAILSEPGYTNYYIPSMTHSYCAYTNAAPPGVTHIAATAAAFTNLVYADARASDYHLAVGSLLIDAGNPGSPYDLDGTRADIGIYGGQHPYVDGGVPDYPFAVQVEVPYSAPLNGTMRIWGRGRVGPGN